MIYLSSETRERVEALASRLNTRIPGEIDIVAWALPILEALVERLEKLERQLQEQK